MADRKGRDPLFRQSPDSRAALGVRWAPCLLPGQREDLKSARLESVDSPAAIIWKNFRSSQTYHSNPRSNFANYRERRWQSTDLAKQYPLAERLRGYVSGERNTFVHEETANPRRQRKYPFFLDTGQQGGSI